MKTEWDYTKLAEAYLKRPDYASAAIDRIISCAGVEKGAPVCDIGAGVGHLTIPLAKRGLQVTSVEPNDAMRTLGAKRTEGMGNVAWREATAEATGQAPASVRLVTYGSSFNVTNRSKALAEAERILAPSSRWIAMLWNHRDLEDPVQSAIEGIIKKHIDSYDYGTRREDQTEFLKSTGLFKSIEKFEETIVHSQSKEDCKEAWRSHATLARQAGGKFNEIVSEIGELIDSLKGDEVKIPYVTRVWISLFK